MRYFFITLMLAGFFGFSLVSCKKPDTHVIGAKLTTRATVMATLGCNSHPLIDTIPIRDNSDTTEHLTVLGDQHTNPYLIANMRQAYNNLGYSSLAVPVTHYYVRFRPRKAADLSYLDSTMDVQGLELFDKPMDYDALQEGDHYQDPSIPDTSVTYQYAVVPTTFLAPDGMNSFTILLTTETILQRIRTRR